MADEGPIKRLNYFKHQFLKVEDFVLEQKYHINLRRRHNQFLHTWGVADGLKVSFDQGSNDVRVSEGIAIDSEGREIILTEERTLPLASFNANTPVYVVISYAEKPTDPSNETGAEGDRRVTEEPNLRAVTEKPESDAGTNLLLAKVNRDAAKVVTGFEETDRRAAGVAAGELSVRRLILRPTGDVNVNLWPRLIASGPSMAALENSSLKLDAGREVFFTDNGQIKSFDGSHRLFFNRQANRMELHEFGDIVMLTGGANPTEKLRVGASGNVGIGTNDPKFLLSFANALGDKIALWGSGENHYGFGIQGGQLQIHTDGVGSDVVFGFGSSANFNETMRIKGAGRVGVGTNAPFTQLHIRKDVGGALGPVLTLMNGAGAANAGAAIDLHSYDPGPNNDPAARLRSLDDGNFSSHFSFQTKAPGANANKLVERLRITNDGDLVLTGKVFSPMWRAFQVAESVQGGLPKQFNFNTNGGLVILFVSGSGWNPSSGLIGMSIKVDGSEKAKARGFSNEVNSHKTFVPVQLVVALAAGQHTVRLDALAGTSSDGNDFFNVTGIELPINADFSLPGILIGGIVAPIVVSPAG